VLVVEGVDVLFEFIYNGMLFDIRCLLGEISVELLV
jgi:hypothetical protein